MRGSSDPGVNVLVFNLEVHIYPVDQLGLQVAEEVPGHRSIMITLTSVLFIGLLTDLNARTIERYILVLNGTDQHDVLEPLKSGLFCKAVQTCVFDLVGVCHR